MVERTLLRLLVLDGEDDFAQLAINRRRKAGRLKSSIGTSSTRMRRLPSSTCSCSGDG